MELSKVIYWGWHLKQKASKKRVRDWKTRNINAHSNIATHNEDLAGIETLTKRYWQRTNEPHGSWFPLGLLLPLLFALYLVGALVVAPSMERQTENAVKNNLNLMGLDVSAVESRGQGVGVEVNKVGDAPVSLASIQSYAEGARCDTWAGRLVCPTRVEISAVDIRSASINATPLDVTVPRPEVGLSGSSGAFPVSSSLAPSSAQDISLNLPDGFDSAAFSPLQNRIPSIDLGDFDRSRGEGNTNKNLKAFRHHDFVLTKRDNAFVLNGEVPNLLRHTEVIQAAKNLADRDVFDKRYIIADKLKITDGTAMAVDDVALDSALSIIEHLKAGRVSWKNGVLDVEGYTFADQKYLVESYLDNVRADLIIGREIINIEPQKIYAQACDGELAAQLEKIIINFETGRSVLTSESRQSIANLANNMRACEGLILVEGHTDNIGDSVFNQGLSDARAFAVRDTLIELNIPSERINAFGYGETIPIASNATDSGRALNRRTVIRIVGVSQE